MKREVIFLKGIQASGKSTYADDFVKKHQDYKRVSRDSFRHMLSSYTYNGKNEDIVENVYKQTIKTLLQETDKNIILDEMNLNEDRIKNTKIFISSIVPDIVFKEIMFDVKLEDAIERDKRRPFSVGETVIRQTYNKHFIKMDDSWKIKKCGLSFNANELCIIVDVDGTLAERGARNAYDFSKIKEDKVISQVRSIINRFYNDHFIIVFSGRDDICQKETEEWLSENDICFDYLYMRKTGDNRKDSIVKKELFDKHIKGTYLPFMWIDDRPQVCEMVTNKLGIFLINVNQDPYALNDF